MPFTYILRCADNSFYVGSTRTLETRIEQHCSGFGSEYTAKRRPLELVWFEEFERMDDAYLLERKLHGWSRAKKEALIAGDFAALPGLSRSRRGKRSD